MKKLLNSLLISAVFFFSAFSANAQIKESKLTTLKGLGYKITAEPDATQFSISDAKEGSITVQAAGFALKNAKGNSYTLSVVNVISKGGTEIHTVIEDAKGNSYTLTNNALVQNSVPKASDSALLKCISQYFGTVTESCTSCVNCIKNCVNNNSRFWARLVCCIRCASPCWKCVSNIIGFVKCAIVALKR
jgi:hypothetical protein